MNRIFPPGLACLAIVILGAGCHASEEKHQPSATSTVVSSGDRLLGLNLGIDDYARYLSVREADELRYLADRPEQLREIAMDYHSDSVLARYAEAEGLAEIPLVRERLEKARRQILLTALAEKVQAEIEYPPLETLEKLARERYQRSAAEFVRPGGRRVAHILITPNNCRLRGTGEEDPQSIAAELRARLEAGEDFAVLAEQYSDDPGTWRSGGELPEPVRRNGRTIAAFEEAAFALSEEGEVSEPVVTRAGAHLIKLLERIEPEPIPFEDVRESLIAREKEQIRFSAQEKLRASAYPVPKAIDVEEMVALVTAAAQEKDNTP